MSTSTQLAMTRQNLDGAWREALFASGLQPSDAPTAQMAQEFGDHPDAAARRMRWVHGLAEVAIRSDPDRTGPLAASRPPW